MEISFRIRIQFVAPDLGAMEFSRGSFAHIAQIRGSLLIRRGTMFIMQIVCGRRAPHVNPRKKPILNADATINQAQE